MRGSQNDIPDEIDDAHNVATELSHQQDLGRIVGRGDWQRLQPRASERARQGAIYFIIQQIFFINQIFLENSK